MNPHLAAVMKSKEQSFDVTIIDISRNGLRFRSKNQFDKGDKLMFELNSDDSTKDLSISIKAKLVNVYGDQPEGFYDYGVKFLRFHYWYEMNRIHDYVYTH